VELILASVVLVKSSPLGSHAGPCKPILTQLHKPDHNPDNNSKVWLIGGGPSEIHFQRHSGDQRFGKHTYIELEKLFLTRLRKGESFMYPYTEE
jgi:hypothetical protein